VAHAASPSVSASASQTVDVDVVVVGGGINGAGIARDLAGRGLSVLLAEAQDLAMHTSSSSSKLIHGGLRYLEFGEFGLVRKALQEREVLLKSAPHIMWPLRFVMPHDPSMRPAWLIRLGLFFYDHLARRELLPGSRGIDLRKHEAGVPLQARFVQGFEYSDGWVDDARLVLLNALDARFKGAEVLTRSPVVAARRAAQHWDVTIATPRGERQVRAGALVNAAGPWAEQFLREVAQAADGETLATRHLRLVKGSHIVVPRCFDHAQAYIFQNPDKRIIFALPYEQDYTLIGTTDLEVSPETLSGRAKAQIEAQEVAYLCEQASRYFRRPVLPEQVVWSYAGVRPLLDDESGNPSAVTRDYLLETQQQGAPLLTVWGGKITTFRKLAQDAADEVCRMLRRRAPAWTSGAFLPGGDWSAWTGAPSGSPQDQFDHFEHFVQQVQQRYAFLPLALARRLARQHGARVAEVLAGVASRADLGQEVAPGLFEAELRYLQREEWACSADDVLWRRTKLGLRLTPAEREAVAAWWTK